MLAADNGMQQFLYSSSQRIEKMTKSAHSICSLLVIITLVSYIFAAGIPFGSVNLLHGVDENESKARPL